MASSSRANTENGDNDGEDDFGDFGGFEGAEPDANMYPAQASAADSPWAAFTAGNAPDRPDLLCAQNRFPNYLDPNPSDILGAPSGPANVNSNNATDNIAAQPHENLFPEQNHNQLDPARVAENVLDGTLNAAAGAGFHSNHNLNLVNGRLPDIGLGINEDRLFGQAEALNRPAVNPSNDTPPLELPQHAAPENIAGAGPPNVVLQAALGREEPENSAEQPQLRSEEVAAGHLPVEETGAEARQVTDGVLEERISSLTERNHILEEELTRCQENLAAQRSRLQGVQDSHKEDLEAIRKAGHDALAVVVDQYKEQSQAVVLEQQEIAQRHITQTLSEQTKAFQEILQTQREIYERQREEDRQELARRIDGAVEESRQQLQAQFDAFLSEEREKEKKEIERVVEEERAASQAKLQKMIEAEQEQAKANLADAKAEFSQKLDEEKQSHEAALKLAREEMQRLAKEETSELVSQERERGAEAMREALEASRLDTRAYIDEQRQADSRVRRQHLASLDLFLESSRQQIGLLLESEKPDSSSSSSSSSKVETKKDGGSQS